MVRDARCSRVDTRRDRIGISVAGDQGETCMEEITSGATGFDEVRCESDRGTRMLENSTEMVRSVDRKRSCRTVARVGRVHSTSSSNFKQTTENFSQHSTNSDVDCNEGRHGRARGRREGGTVGSQGARGDVARQLTEKRTIERNERGSGRS